MSSRTARVLTALGLAVVMTFLGAGVTLAATVAAGGLVTVQVEEAGPGGGRLLVPVPAALLDLGLGVAALAIPAGELRQLRAEAAPFQPALAAIARGIEECPDAVLVEVVTDRESVRVTKRGATLVIDVDAEDGEVRVALPARTLTRVARFLAA
jgi:hypothetical protein